MKVWFVAFLSLGLGAVLGVANGWLEMRSLKERFETGTPADAGLGGGGRPGGFMGAPQLVVVNGEEYDFGTLERNVTRQRKFLFKNEGRAPLQVGFKAVSCGQCLETKFASAAILPGATEDVVVAYSTKKPDTMFQELIEFTTNDPDRPVVRLTIRGVVPDLFRADRDTLSLGEVSANDTATAEARIYAFFTNDIRIVDHQFINPETARFFELRSAPLAADELAKERLAKGAVVASVTVKPGLPLGPVNQGVRLTTNLGSGAVVQLRIEGAISSDVALVGGSRFDAKQNVFSFGPVRRDEGAAVTLHLMVRGPHRDSVRFQIGRVDPADVLRASIGSPAGTKSGALLYPIKLEIPKGSRLINRLGSVDPKKLEGLGEVLIETTHPQAKQVLLYVRFAVGS